MKRALFRAVATTVWALGIVVLLPTIVFAGPQVVDRVSATTPSAATSATTWAIEPASADGPDGRVSLRHYLEAATEVMDHVTVTNFGPEPATFHVYASDGIVSPSGDFDILASGEQPVDGGSWITVGPAPGAIAGEGGGLLLDLASGAAVTLPITVSVPVDASPGDHPAGVVAELVGDDADGLQFATRVGVRLHLRVTGDVVAAVTPNRLDVVWTPSWNPFAPGTTVVTFVATNDGNVRIGADADVSVSGPFGLAPAQAQGSVREVLPGQDASFEIQLESWPLFYAWGDVTVTPVAVGEDAVPELDSATTRFTVWTVPWSQLVLLVLLGCLIMLFRVQRRRSAARIQERISAAVAAARAEPLGSEGERTPAMDGVSSQSGDAGPHVEVLGRGHSGLAERRGPDQDT